MKDDVRGVSAAVLRARYAALGAERTFFGIAAVGTVLGLLFPIARTPMLLFMIGGGDIRFYNLGIAGG